MRTISKEELAKIVEKHGRWLRGEDGVERADLSGVDLRWADLTVADLQDAIDEWIRQIVESKKLAFSGGEAELPLSVRDGDAQQERATTGRKMKKKVE